MAKKKMTMEQKKQLAAILARIRVDLPELEALNETLGFALEDPVGEVTNALDYLEKFAREEL